MARLSTERLMMAATWFALVGWGALAAWWAPDGLRGPLALASLTFDAALAGGLVILARRSDRRSRAQSADVQAALGIVLELTSQQQGRWMTLLDGVAALEPEDRATFEPLLHHRKDFIPQVTVSPTGSTIDAIQTIILLNQSLMDDLGRVLAFYESTYQRLQEMRRAHRINHFRLHESVDFLANIGTSSNHYSEAMVLGILTTFKQITHLSSDISTKVVGTMNQLMDPSNTTGLAAILHESAQINALMDAFFNDLNQAMVTSQKAVTENIEQMDRVKEMSDAIGEFSESIRMISLNLNIEAARGHGGNGKGFQVLAVKLSEFALRAQTLATEQHSIIERASEIMHSSGDHEMARLRSLLAQVPKLRGHLVPFEGIVANTFREFEKVGSSMTGLASSIGDELRAVIGKLQFQDLVRQEHEHVLAMFAHIRDLADEANSADGDLDAAEENRLREAIIHHFECLATTENEWAVVREYRSRHGGISETGTCSDPSDGPRTLEAGKVALF